MKNKINMTDKLESIGERVIIKPDEISDMTKGGIIIPETGDKPPHETGTIVAVGEGRKTSKGKIIPMRVKVGDKVLFAPYGPLKMEVDGVLYLSMLEENLLAIIK